MSENRFGYAMTPTFGVRSDAATNLKNMDMALRAEILSNARKQYEATARELRLKAQAKIQTQQAEIHARPPVYERLATSQEQMLERSSARTYPQPHIRSTNSQLSNSSRYSTPPLPSHPSPNLPSRFANTPTAMLYRFRQIPGQTNNIITKDKGRAKEEGRLALEELKRRYYEQLANQKRASYSRIDYYHNHQRPRHNVEGSRSSVAAVGRPHSQYDPYDHASPTGRGRARTMADEYLDYYMPARRGPHSVASHQRNREPSYRQARRETAEQSHRRESPERIYRPEMKCRTGTYEPEPRPAHGKEELLKPSHCGKHEQTLQPLPTEQQVSKGKLAFLLNSSDAKDSRSMHRPNQDERFDGSGHLGRGNHSSGPHASELGTRGELPSTGVQEGASYARYSHPMKRKASLGPNSADVSDTGSEDEAPRPKRRAFGRLPAETDSQSELEQPEDKETDGACIAEMPRSSKALERIRDGVERPATYRTGG